VLLEIEHLTKVYKKGVRANDDVCLAVDAGQVFGLLGHNGAGKTTLLNQVIGLAKPTAGSIRVAGRDVIDDPAAARTLCSYQPQALAPLDRLTPRQGIELTARLRGASKQRARQRAVELLAALDIEEWADTISDKLSGGVRRLTAFCMAAAEAGKVVMFDEPTNDVDPVRRRLLWRQIRALADTGRAVVLITHNVVEAERAVEHLVILDHGKVVARGTPAQLRGDHDDHGDRLRLELIAVDNRAAAQLPNECPGAEQPAAVAGRRALIPIQPEAVAEALTWAQQQRAAGRVEEFSATPVSLEDVYISVVGSQTGNKEANDAALVA
jgi:ABC-2 type transport system ATP-binding protein